MTNDEVLIRMAGVGDAPVLTHLRYRWRVDERGEAGPEEPAFSVALAEWMVVHQASHIPFLAERDAQAIGMTWLALVERVPGPRRFVRRSAYVQSTYVVPTERSKGVGTQLMRFALDHARGVGCDYVAVHPSQPAFEFYRRLGLVETDRVLEIRF